MIQVILIKGPGKAPRIWTHDILADAIKRAEALAYLHSAEIQHKDFGYVIDATAYYAPKGRKS
jgi:hypothetical protein